MIKWIDIDTLHSISLDIAQIFFAYMFVGQLFIEKINTAYLFLGVLFSLVFWFFGLLLAKLKKIYE